MAKQQILVLGAAGLVGHYVREHLASTGEGFTALSHPQLDIAGRDDCLRVLDSARPGIVINCAALCNFRACEERPDQSERINRDAPIWWAGECARRGIKFCHFSTDYIFGGGQRTPYREDDVPQPTGVYAHHKAEVEREVTAIDAPHLIFRVAWVFGRQGKTFMSLLPKMLLENEEVTVAAGKVGSCLYAGYAAGVIVGLSRSPTRGVLNLVHSGEASWEGFAEACLQWLRDHGLEPRCRNLKFFPFDEMAALGGPRPAYSALDTSKLASILGTQPPVWQEGMEGFLTELWPDRGRVR